MNTVDLTTLETEKIESSLSTWRDWVGITASVGCAIHCAAMPFVIAYLPAFGLSFLADEAFHKWMALICCLLYTSPSPRDATLSRMPSSA